MLSSLKHKHLSLSASGLSLSMGQRGQIGSAELMCTRTPLKHGGKELALGEIIMMMFYLPGST